MAVFENLGKKVSQMSQGALKKTQQLADVTTLKSKIEDEKKSIASFYTQIGMHYYETYAASPQDGELARLCQSLTEANERIEQYTKEIADIRGVRRCPNCGAEVPRAAAFCPECGTKAEPLEQPAEAQHKVCEFCGAQLEADAKFCPGCGAKD